MGSPWRDSTMIVGPALAMASAQACALSLASAGRITRMPGMAQACQVLDRLMRRAVLAKADQIVGEHEHDRQLHQRGEPDRLQHVVAEGEEGQQNGRQPP